MEKNLSVFTVCNAAYLPKTLALAESAYNNAGVVVDIFIIDGKRGLDLGGIKSCVLHWVEDLNIPNYRSLAFKYDIIELSTSLKPFLAKYLLQSSENVIFFDPDVLVYNSVSSIVDELQEHSVIVTPHYLEPKRSGDIDDNRLMKFGFYNLGFFAVKSDTDGIRFLDWWEERCFENCFNDAQSGIFTDQKWVNIATGFFPFIHASKHLGYNVAYWNIDQRKITKQGGKYYMSDGSPLVFFHYSSFDTEHPEKLAKRSFSIGVNSKDIIKELGDDYDKQLHTYNVLIKNKIYTYDYFSNGMYINPTLRRAYASCIDKFAGADNIFSSDSEVYAFAKKNKLLTAKNNFKYKGYSNLENSSIKRKMKCVIWALRAILRFAGPNNFMNLSRLMVYLSSFHKVPELWKIK